MVIRFRARAIAPALLISPSTLLTTSRCEPIAPAIAACVAATTTGSPSPLSAARSSSCLAVLPDAAVDAQEQLGGRVAKAPKCLLADSQIEVCIPLPKIADDTQIESQDV